ncbi:GntR family transcriptional regulator [Microbacterium sp. ASV49]|uniref:GntR family transcriptional regulator n=1 Tax=Microbacterium candidum TaxID=3041922 RepID=A0ABT7N1L6_9MICO|nr:GntR family transcriptional regulator [Microbacterium sp. ASV49]MDL9980589.1 GntR family transcriptional regulator [Microbacterium sp. ASV49]
MSEIAAAVDEAPSLVDIGLEYIRDRIVSGEYPPGTRLKERDLVDRIGISRVPVREALRSLATEGFVTLSPRRGAVVTPLELQDLDEIFEVREALEVFECTLAAQKARPDEVARLLATVDEAEAAIAAGDHERVVDANQRFHAVLVEMSHNDVLARMLEPMRNRLNWLLRQNDDNLQLCREHRGIADAIAAGDARKVRRLAAAHVNTSKKIATEWLFGARAR